MTRFHRCRRRNIRTSAYLSSNNNISINRRSLVKRIGSSLRSYIKHPISGSKKRRTVRRTSIILSLSTLAVIIVLPITLMRLYGSESLDAFLTRDIQQLVTQVKLILPFGLLGAVSWVIWLVRWILSRTYQPTVNN